MSSSMRIDMTWTDATQRSFIGQRHRLRGHCWNDVFGIDDPTALPDPFRDRDLDGMYVRRGIRRAAIPSGSSAPRSPAWRVRCSRCSRSPAARSRSIFSGFSADPSPDRSSSPTPRASVPMRQSLADRCSRVRAAERVLRPLDPLIEPLGAVEILRLRSSVDQSCASDVADLPTSRSARHHVPIRPDVRRHRPSARARRSAGASLRCHRG